MLRLQYWGWSDCPKASLPGYCACNQNIGNGHCWPGQQWVQCLPCSKQATDYKGRGEGVFPSLLSKENVKECDKSSNSFHHKAGDVVRAKGRNWTWMSHSSHSLSGLSSISFLFSCLRPRKGMGELTCPGLCSTLFHSNCHQNPD